MNIAHLQNFVRIVEAGSLSRAADIIGIVQPALSRQVRSLEREFGVELLTRHGAGVSPTPAGEALAAAIRRLLGDLQSAREIVHAIEHEPAGLVTVGAPSSLAEAFFPPLFARLRARHPRIRLRLLDELSSPLLQRTMRGEIDIAILHRDRSLERLKGVDFLEEPLGLVGEPAALGALESVSPQALQALPILAPTAPNRSRIAVESMIGSLESQLVAEVECLPALLSILARGEGFAILSYSAAARAIARGELGFRPIEGPAIVRRMVLVRAGENRPTAAAAAVERELRGLAVDMASEMHWTPSIATDAGGGR